MPKFGIDKKLACFARVICPQITIRFTRLPSPAAFMVLVEAAGNHLLVVSPADTLGPPLVPEVVIGHSLVCSSAAELTEPSLPTVVDAL